MIGLDWGIRLIDDIVGMIIFGDLVVLGGLFGYGKLFFVY